PLLGGAAVQEPGDSGVIQPGEDLSLAPEEAEDLLAVGSPDHLQGDPLVELLVRPGGEPHRSHPAAPQLAKELVRADAPLRVEARPRQRDGAFPRLPGDAGVLDGVAAGLVHARNLAAGPMAGKRERRAWSL